MANPWLEIPAADYEGHMASKQVGQLQVLSRLFQVTLEAYRPSSVAVLGCCTGNGFEHINPEVTRRVVGIDINGDYLEVLKQRHGKRIDTSEIFQHNILQAPVPCPPVDLVFAALVFEYLTLPVALEHLCPLVRPGGLLIAGLQLPSEHSATITETGFSSLKKLSSIMKLVDPESFCNVASINGFEVISREEIPLLQGKKLFAGTFQKME